MKSSEVVAFVHAKGTSKRLPGKNLADLGGQPLFTHAVRNAMAAKHVGRVVVDSDSDEILSIAKGLGAETLKRPAELATNGTTGDDLAYWQARNAGWADIIVQVVPTSPFIKPKSIDDAVEGLGCFYAIVGVRSERLYLWDGFKPTYYEASGKLPNSDTLPLTTWETTGLYVMRTEYVLQNRRRVHPDCNGRCKLSVIEAIDINTQEDLDFARIVWKGIHG